MTEEQIKEKLKIYLDKKDFNIPTFVDMVNFAQKIATEATKKLQEENVRLRKESEENQDLATIAYMQGASKYKTKLDYAKTIIQDLLSNSDEYARQRAVGFFEGGINDIEKLQA